MNVALCLELGDLTPRPVDLLLLRLDLALTWKGLPRIRCELLDPAPQDVLATSKSRLACTTETYLSPGSDMTVLIRTLVLLGCIAQIWLLYELRYDLPVIASSGELALYLSPIILAAVGAGLATWLSRHGSRWAWLAAGLPAALLVLGLGLAVLLTLFPIALHQR